MLETNKQPKKQSACFDSCWAKKRSGFMPWENECLFFSL